MTIYQPLPKSAIALGGGRYLDLLDPQPADIDVYRLCRVLAGIPRWSGQPDTPWTVGQHSLVVGKIVQSRYRDPKLTLAALLHDGHEYATGDINTPLKRLLGPAIVAIQGGLDAAICDRVGVDIEAMHGAIVKAVDVEVGWCEAILFGMDADDPDQRKFVPARYEMATDIEFEIRRFLRYPGDDLDVAALMMMAIQEAGGIL
ncbi:hypothetical protein [Aurantimonas coralicida]|uniref:hypothetical protein n=1 Tax=Aurantimonas coralicida TaxID=182270 RepID=UPI0003FB6811|nr:hypothetical protein [Aurantimonas coralicida]